LEDEQKVTIKNILVNKFLTLSCSCVLCIVNKENHLDQLKLALAWNRIEFAKNEIFTTDVSWQVSCFVFYCSIS